jgi:RNA polymerase sigma-70 factor (ECF subfamily)
MPAPDIGNLPGSAGVSSGRSNPMEPAPEDDLVLRARAGDGAAWEDIVRRQLPAVFRLAYLILGDPDEAEDAAQETFIRAFRALDRFDPVRPLRPWLLRIARNLARNQRRSAGRYFGALQRLVASDPEVARASTDRRDPLDPRGQAADTLWRAIRRLPGIDQEVLYLRYFLELTEAETAAVCGLPRGTVKSRTHRALAKLREIVEREFPSLHEVLEK